MEPQQYISERLDDQINWYDTSSSRSRRWFRRLQVVEMVAAALIPLLSTRANIDGVSWAVGLLGALIAICAGSMSLFQLQKHWLEYRTTAESLKKEKFLYLTHVEPYDSDEAFGLLVQRVETLVSKENTNWAQYMMKPEAGKGG